jgi:nucleoid DNA-binding protein
MDKRDLVRAVAKATGKPITTVEVIVGAVFEEITSALHKGEVISLGGFGSFSLGAAKPPKKSKAK